MYILFIRHLPHIIIQNKKTYEWREKKERNGKKRKNKKIKKNKKIETKGKKKEKAQSFFHFRPTF